MTGFVCPKKRRMSSTNRSFRGKVQLRIVNTKNENFLIFYFAKKVYSKQAISEVFFENGNIAGMRDQNAMQFFPVWTAYSLPDVLQE